MLLAEVAAAEGPEVTCEMGRARLITTTISSPGQGQTVSTYGHARSDEIERHTDGSHPSSRLGLENVDTLGDQSARVVDHLRSRSTVR